MDPSGLRNNRRQLPLQTLVTCWPSEYGSWESRGPKAGSWPPPPLSQHPGFSLLLKFTLNKNLPAFGLEEAKH